MRKTVHELLPFLQSQTQTQSYNHEHTTSTLSTARSPGAQEPRNVMSCLRSLTSGGSCVQDFPSSSQGTLPPPVWEALPHQVHLQLHFAEAVTCTLISTPLEDWKIEVNTHALPLILDRGQWQEALAAAYQQTRTDCSLTLTQHFCVLLTRSFFAGGVSAGELNLRFFEVFELEGILSPPPS